jgi:4-hydroxy-tetrahydrodipicolinate reductase
MPPLRVVVSGSGNMGDHVMAAITAAEAMSVVGVLDGLADDDHCTLPDGSDVPLRRTVDDLETFQADVVVDFTNAEWTELLLPKAIAIGVRPVVGTSGLATPFVAQMVAASAEAGVGGVIASNFALGAVMMMHLARVAAPHFESVEVIEQHHDGKVDAPSGTAMTTAEEMRKARGSDFRRNVAERETLPNARGSEFGGVTLHSVRLPGLVAHQEVIFGGTGETLKLRHDSISRESFMPGVVRAVRESGDLDRIVVGLDRLLGLID